MTATSLRPLGYDLTRLLSFLVPSLALFVLWRTEYAGLPGCYPHCHATKLLSSSSKTSKLPLSLLQPLPSCASTGRAKSFLFVFMGHSGSSAILSELESHSETLLEGREPIDHYEYETNTTLALEFTRELFRRGIAEGRTTGFKMRPQHIGKDPEAWAQLAREFDTRIIWQFRHNILKQAVGEYSYKYLNDSAVIEGLRNETAVKERCEQGVGCKFAISDMDFFHRTLTDCVHSDLSIVTSVRDLANGSECIYSLPYEDYLYHRETTLRRLFKFLGLSWEQTQPQRWKATRDNLCEVVENWDELCEEFYGCQAWRHFFDDAENNCGCHKFRSGGTHFCDPTFRP